MISRAMGNLGEEAVSRYLEKYGYTVLERNYCIKGGEIDIIACNCSFIVFTEVKTRKKGSMISGLEAIDSRKKKLIIKTAVDYCCKNPTGLQPRFDVAEVTTMDDKVVKINYISNAFDTTGYDIIF